MASKQLGKLRQWGREVISSKEKTVLTEEFKQLEQDIELRKVGIERLHAASSEYHVYLQKKKEYPTVEVGVKMLPVDALGAVMMSHGEEFGNDSAFGQCLLQLGRAHCKIATLQETYALALHDTYLASLEGSLSDLSDYSAQRKKLDSRRLAYDAAVTKAGKAKKEKDVKEADEELTKAKLRYEETSTDVQARMHAIQDNEIRQLRDLTELLSLETHFVAQYLDVLRDTQKDWLDESVIQRAETPRRRPSPHAFASRGSTPSISSTSKTSIPRPPSRSADGSLRSSGSEDGDDLDHTAKQRPSPAEISRPNSRGSTRSTGTAHTGRRRRDSAASDGVTDGKRSIAGWASNAVSSLSVPGLGRKEAKNGKSPTKEATRAFATLDAGEDDSDDDGLRRETDGITRTLGISSLSKVLGQTPPTSIQQPSKSTNSSSSSSFNSSSSSFPSSSRKVMRAIFDFSGSAEELSFYAGDEITVLSRDKDGWSTGELSGRRGLFPTNYVEDISSTGARVPPRLTSNQQQMSKIAQRAQFETMSEDGASIAESDDVYPMDNHLTLYDEPFGDHHLAKSPMMLEHDREHDRDASETEDEDENRGLFKPSPTPALNGTITKPAENGVIIGNIAGNVVGVAERQPPALPQRRRSTKKAPPPPPARRLTITSSAPGLNGQSVSAPVSTTNIPLGTVSFPPPPEVPKRMIHSRAHSATVLPRTSLPSTSISPFDN